jgi:hypothetical protein
MSYEALPLMQGKNETHYFFFRKLYIVAWGYSSVVQCLPSMRKALGLIPSSTKKKISVPLKICTTRFIDDTKTSLYLV